MHYTILINEQTRGECFTTGNFSKFDDALVNARNMALVDWVDDGYPEEEFEDYCYNSVEEAYNLDTISFQVVTAH